MTRSFTQNQKCRVETLESRRYLAGTAYIEQALVADQNGAATKTDAHLVNPWGLAANSHGLQIADNGTGLSTDYDASGNAFGPTVHVPGHGSDQGAPTGIVANGSSASFLVPKAGGGTAPAQFIFVTENGTIDAWNTADKNRTVSVVVDHSADGAVYKGVAISAFRHKQYVYAANFTAHRIDVFKSDFSRARLPGSFGDPNLPSGYSPFNVQQINGQLYVMFAKKDPNSVDEQAGAGLGVVDVFGSDGKLVKRLTSGGVLNAPWGVAQAPSNFGSFSNDILVGNFGDGWINAFDPKTGKLQGSLSDSNGSPFAIQGLWGIAFGNGKGGTLKNALYFAAGPGDEAHGLYGRLLVDTSVAPASNPGPYSVGVQTTMTASRPHHGTADQLSELM